MRENFLFGTNTVNFNHGAFGSNPIAVREAFQQFQKDFDGEPSIFVRFKTPYLLNEARSCIAELLHAPREECVFVQNATTGIGTILHNLEFRDLDVIIYFDTMYGAIQMMLASLFERYGVQSRKVVLQFPTTHRDVLASFLETVDSIRREGLNPRMAIFDTIVSSNAQRLPFEALTEICRKEGIQSLIDGAHSVGQIALDLSRLQPDFFVTDCHKWLFVPRACAVLYVAMRNQHLICSTMPTSWGFIPRTGQQDIPPTMMGSFHPQMTDFERLFHYIATGDDIPALCVPAAIKFRREVCGGEDRIHQYLHKLAVVGTDIVAETLHTEALQEPGLQKEDISDMRRCGVGAVRLPIQVSGDSKATNFTAPVALLEESDVLPAMNCIWGILKDHGIWIPIHCYHNWLWVRICAQIYLEEEDFRHLASILQEACQQVAKVFKPAK
ncbi:pyridoxal phosphate-dependent transferase [Aspergillus granulosus]|uniref:Pyridoxal phosphate-dependent transferase n=1 Tax=Aspergillus granulosus TaxID=176169 RepID=A0ABR4HPT6_9EURO